MRSVGSASGTVMGQYPVSRMPDRMEEKDLNDLARAVVLLEKPGLGIRFISLIGYPIEGILSALPGPLARAIGTMAGKAVGTALYAALRTLGKKTSRGKPHRWLHRILVLLSGAIGGFFGFPGLMLELPISTTLMFRSIAGIARREGEDLSSGDAQMACITVFALGGRSKIDNPADTAYYATRAAVTRALSEAAEFITQRGMTEEGAPMLVRLMANVASRFGLVVTDKVAAEVIPIVGALGGASINLVFIDHLQAAAQGHFTVRRLERKYGGERVRREYERVLNEQLSMSHKQ
jgi:hypothetical protein